MCQDLQQHLVLCILHGIVKRSIARLGLDPKLYGTHSCRAGGATDLAPKVSVMELLVSGRWADPRSIRHYVEIDQDERFRLNSLAQCSSTARSSDGPSILSKENKSLRGHQSPQELMSRFWGGSNALKNGSVLGRSKHLQELARRDWF